MTIFWFDIFCFFILLSTLLYASAVFKCWQVWQSIPVFNHKKAHPSTVFVSVIVPVRNEAKNITALLTDLAKQSYPLHLFEMILIDDYSEDATLQVVSDFKNLYPQIGLQILKAEAEPLLSNKKRSITQAIGVAKGELIACTDGDCRVGENWLSTLTQFYEQHQFELISAPVALALPKSNFGKMQVVEFASLIVSGAASIALGYPTMANGANIAYTKKIFAEVNGFEGNLHINTGDDEFLIQKIAAKYPAKIGFLKSKAAIVRTSPLASFAAFYHQRIRWASKWKYKSAKHLSWLALCIFAYHLLNLLAWGLLFLGFIYPQTYLIIILVHFLLKFCIEFVLLISILDFAKDKKYSIYIIPLQLVYSFYVVFIGILSNFARYHWKGRTVK